MQAGVSAAALQVQDPELHPRARSQRRTPRVLSTPVGLLRRHWDANKIPSSSAGGKTNKGDLQRAFFFAFQ